MYKLLIKNPAHLFNVWLMKFILKNYQIIIIYQCITCYKKISFTHPETTNNRSNSLN